MAPAPAPSTSTSPVTGQPESIADDGPSISVRNLSYTFASTTTTTTTTTSGSTSSTPSVVLHDVSFDLPSGSRTLLIGANGAGKTTLLRLLSGGKLAPSGRIRVGGVDPFTTGLEGVTYLGLEWALNPIVRNDIEVWRLLDSVCGVVRGPGGPGGRAGKSSSEHGGDLWRERRNELVRVLDVDEDWHMNLVSDGERRRVQSEGRFHAATGAKYCDVSCKPKLYRSPSPPYISTPAMKFSRQKLQRWAEAFRAKGRLAPMA